MAGKNIDPDKVPAGPALDALVAEKVMGWKELKRQGDRYWGKKQDKAGRWRSAPVDDYSYEPTAAARVEDRIRELGLFERYEKELAKISHAQKLPSGWAAPDQRCRAAVKAVSKRKRK
jgi:hypothetical protein